MLKMLHLSLIHIYQMTYDGRSFLFGQYQKGYIGEYDFNISVGLNAKSFSKKIIPAPVPSVVSFIIPNQL